VARRALRVHNAAMVKRAGALLLCLGWSSLAAANDSSALLEAGGIVLTKSDDVVMESEDLSISRELVRVSYQFRNTGKADVQTRVAFPLPGLPQCDDDHEGDCEGDMQVRGKPPNWILFKLTVDGKRRPFQTERKLDMKDGVGKLWITHHWEQDFPKDRPVAVQHEYVPVAGGFFTRPGDPAWAREMAEKYCVGPKLIEAMKRAGGEQFVWAVHYTLKTGANWKGPIRRFKLTIVKDAPADKVSVCLPDTRKVSPRNFEVTRQDFVPTDDLRVLFIPGEQLKPK
jgi:hypothetical protein